MRTHGDIIAVEDGVKARVLDGRRGVDDAIALLDAAERAAGVPLVDESERARLHELAAGASERAPHWHSLLARREGRAVGYAGVVVAAGARAPDEPDTVVADLALDRDRPPCGPVIAALLAGTEALGRRHGAARLQVWIRHARPSDVACAVDHGYGIERRLGVLGRPLDDGPPPPDVPPGGRLRAYRPGTDDRAVVRVLEAAYAGTADAGWTVERLADRRSYDWFRPEDVLLLELDGRVVGVHWTKRRGGATGEVYNLAVDPAVQGRGVGATLLLAGLRHLARAGCEDVLLWVDLSNERAVRLYTSHGFTTRWEDLALSRVLR